MEALSLLVIFLLIHGIHLRQTQLQGTLQFLSFMNSALSS